VTETALGDKTRCVCQECSFTWSVSAEGKFEPLPQKSANEDVSNKDPEQKRTAKK
jgi:hypothetical protein